MAGERILLVEDERAVARGLEYGLRAEGFEVLWARDGQSALAIVPPGHPLVEGETRSGAHSCSRSPCPLRR